MVKLAGEQIHQSAARELVTIRIHQLAARESVTTGIQNSDHQPTSDQ